MPWTGSSFASHNKRLHGARAEAAAKQANAVLKATGDEGLAIAVANKNADRRLFGHSKPMAEKPKLRDKGDKLFG